MKKLSPLTLAKLLALLLPCPALADGARIGTLVCIGMTEDDVKQWTSDVAAAEGKDTPYVNDNTIVFYDNLQAMILALNSGEIDRLSIGSLTARYIAERNEGLMFANRQHNAVLGYSIAMLEENSERLESIDTAIAGMKRDGTIDRLKAQYIDNLNAVDPEAVALPVIEGADTIRIAVTGDLPPMDVILADGTPAGFNTAFLAALSERVGVNFELVSVESSARAVALSSGTADALFWTRGTYDQDGNALPYPLDRMEGVAVSTPYLIESRDAVSRAE
ncbi:MAG: transporter substrate-binding domain-containing protein [Eubacteriales bacterium]|nr:transporter substrate-binding domain-containing protein [Eubacteriales bacterium]